MEEWKKIAAEFADPGAAWRSAPFWSWNDRLEPGEVKRQLEQMRQGGYGGAFLHSRLGLLTPYLGREWFASVHAAVEHARETGMLAFLYDEDRWPSGFAGGRVTRHARNQMKALVARRRKNGGLEIGVRVHPAIEYFNGTPYLDTMKAAAVDEFIESTYERYRREVGDEFGRSVPAIFTDEPSYVRGGGLPFTDELPELFAERFGYRLEPVMASLFERKGDWRAVRYDYRRLVTDLFRENYFGRLYRWCERHGLALTGHTLSEDTIPGQVGTMGAVMPIFMYMQIPGVDKLRRDTRFPLTIKQCSSAANQLGRERVLSENFGGSGQDMSFLDRKWIGDWHLALGVNLFCPHLWLYSMAGSRKRDWPPTLSYQQPWWPDNRALEDHFARASCLLARGRYAADVLLLHPVESGFLLWEPLGSARLGREIVDLDDSFRILAETMIGQHIEYDLGDEEIMARHGGTEGERLSVGRMSYRAVVLPEMKTIRRSTLALLERFIEKGGLVFRAALLPETVEGREPGRALDFLARSAAVYRSADDLVATLEKNGLRKVRVRDGDLEDRRVIVHRRVLPGGRQLLFLALDDCRKSARLSVSMSGRGRLERWDTLTGGKEEIPARQGSGTLDWTVELPPAGSVLYLLDGNRASSKEKAPAPPAREVLAARADTAGWSSRALEPNALVLDYASLLSPSGRWLPAMPTWKIQEKLLASGFSGKKIALRFIFDSAIKKIPPGTCLVLERPEQFEVTVNGRALEMRDTGAWRDIAFRKIPAGRLMRPGRNEIILRTVFRPPARPGTRIYRRGGTEIEALFVLGDFAVSGWFTRVGDGYRARKFSPADPVPSGPADCVPYNYYPSSGHYARSGDGYFSRGPFLVEPFASSPREMVVSGYPFYAGRFLFEGELEMARTAPKERYFLDLEDPRGTTFRIRVNGREAGLAFLPPWRVEVTGLLRPGTNRVSVEAANSLRNLLGPHHNNLGELLSSTPPSSFTSTETWTDDYHLVSFGLSGVRVYRRPG